MAVDEAGQDGIPGEVDDPGARGNLGGAGLNRLDAVAPDQIIWSRRTSPLSTSTSRPARIATTSGAAVWARRLAEAREDAAPPRARQSASACRTPDGWGN